jgi:RNA polymerase sigma factor (TIGR02999 family)
MGRSAQPGSDTPTRAAPKKQFTSSTVNDTYPILHALDECDPQSAERLLPLVYDELRRLAAHRMAHQPPGHTLQPTALVHEAFLRLTGNAQNTWANRRHFFAAAAEAMRHILVDRARRKAAARNGGNHVPLQWDDVVLAEDAVGDQVIAVNEALDQLAAQDRTAAELVKLRFFAGFTLGEAAELLDLSERTAKRIWSYARAWLFEEIQRETMAVR